MERKSWSPEAACLIHAPTPAPPGVLAPAGAWIKRRSPVSACAYRRTVAHIVLDSSTFARMGVTWFSRCGSCFSAPRVRLRGSRQVHGRRRAAPFSKRGSRLRSSRVLRPCSSSMRNSHKGGRRVFFPFVSKGGYRLRMSVLTRKYFKLGGSYTGWRAACVFKTGHPLAVFDSL